MEFSTSVVLVFCPSYSNGCVHAFVSLSPQRLFPLSAVHLPAGFLNHMFKHLLCGGCLEALVLSTGKVRLRSLPKGN